MLPRDREDRGFDVKYLDPGSPAFESFERLIARCDRSIATRILGQNNTASADGGSYAKAIALDAIRQDLLESDARSLAETIHRQVLRPWAQYNYGSPDLAPHVVWDATPPADTTALATTHKTAGESIALWSTAAAGVGMAVDVEALAQTYGVPLRRAPAPPAPVAPPVDAAPAPEALSAAPATLAVGQTYTDELVARGTASGARAMRVTLGALAAAIEAADSPEALRASLLSLLGADDPAGLATALARAQTLASLAGRYDVLDDL
jgi:phage gp29-like protein